MDGMPRFVDIQKNQRLAVYRNLQVGFFLLYCTFRAGSRLASSCGKYIENRLLHIDTAGDGKNEAVYGRLHRTMIFLGVV